jgi:hypothetical protein
MVFIGRSVQEGGTDITPLIESCSWQGSAAVDSAMHGPAKVDPGHEYEWSAVLRCQLQSLVRALPGLGISDLPWQASRIFRRLANGPND